MPGVEPDIRGARTIRELLDLHTKAESCAGCHARFDPVGLALENFDILGGWRTRYRGVEQGEPVTGGADALLGFRDYLGGLLAFVEAQLADGRTPDEVLAMREPLPGFEA